MTRERRAFTRIRIDVPACLCLYQLDIRHAGAIVDISMGGCFFPITAELPLHEPCRVQLTTGEGLETVSIELAGVIVRRAGAGVGIQFTDIPEENRLLLERMISREARRYSAE